MKDGKIIFFYTSTPFTNPKAVKLWKKSHRCVGDERPDIDLCSWNKWNTWLPYIKLEKYGIEYCDHSHCRNSRSMFDGQL